MQLLAAIVIGVTSMYALASLAALAFWIHGASTEELLAAMSPKGRVRAARQPALWRSKD